MSGLQEAGPDPSNLGWLSCSWDKLSLCKLSPQPSYLPNSVPWARSPPLWERPWLHPQDLRCLLLSLTPAQPTCIRVLGPAPHPEISADHRQTVRSEIDNYWQVHAPDMPSGSERPRSGLGAWPLCVSTCLAGSILRASGLALALPGWAFER